MQQPTSSAVGSQNVALLQALMKLTSQLRNGASWFYWIAGLSLINSIMYLLGLSWTFFIGLGATQIVDGLAVGFGQALGSGSGLILKGLAFVMDVIVAAVVALFGYQSLKRDRMFYVIGMVLYGVDGLIVLPFGDILGFLFHLIALFGLVQGLRALGKLEKLEKTNIATP